MCYYTAFVPQTECTGYMIFLLALPFCYETTACPKNMDYDIFAITHDSKDLKSCDWYHYVGKWVLHIFTDICWKSMHPSLRVSRRSLSSIGFYVSELWKRTPTDLSTKWHKPTFYIMFWVSVREFSWRILISVSRLVHPRNEVWRGMVDHEELDRNVCT